MLTPTRPYQQVAGTHTSYPRRVTLPSEDRERLLLALRRVDPAGFRSQLRAVLAAHGELVGAALALRVREASLRAWLADDPSIAAGLELA